MLPLRDRVVPLLCVFLGAPLAAEYLQAYLPFTGDPWASLIGVAFFAPLYGGAALLIRELAVRCGLGWTGTLLLAAAFGLAMPGLVDLAMFGEDRSDVAYWADMREPTLIEPIGVSVSTTLSWTVGHVMMSVGAPLALLYTLAPRHRGRPMLGRIGIPLTAAAAALVALAVHRDGQAAYGYSLSAGQAGAVLAVVAVIGAPGVTRPGAPVRGAETGRGVPIAAVVILAVLLKVSIDLMPATWTGVLGTVAVLIAAAAALRWASTHRRWGPREVGALGAGVVIGAILIGFLSPAPEGVSAVAKTAQSATLLCLALLVLAAVLTGRRRLPRCGVARCRSGRPRAPGRAPDTARPCSDAPANRCRTGRDRR